MAMIGSRIFVLDAGFDLLRAILHRALEPPKPKAAFLYEGRAMEWLACSCNYKGCFYFVELNFSTRLWPFTL